MSVHLLHDPMLSSIPLTQSAGLDQPSLRPPESQQAIQARPLSAKEYE